MARSRDGRHPASLTAGGRESRDVPATKASPGPESGVGRREGVGGAGWRAALRLPLVLLAVALLLLAAAKTAGAAVDVGDCPAAPAAYVGLDDSATQLNLLRGENVALCETLTARLDEAANDVRSVHTVLAWLLGVSALALGIPFLAASFRGSE